MLGKARVEAPGGKPPVMLCVVPCIVCGGRAGPTPAQPGGAARQPAKTVHV